MNRKRGVAIEYVIITMALVAALVVTLLTVSSLVAQRARGYRDYLTRKAFLDDAAAAYLEDAADGNIAAGALQERFNDNDMDLKFQVSREELVVTYLRGVVLYVRLAWDEGTPALIAYRYTYVS